MATTVLPDGRPVAVTGSDDRTLRIWDLTTGTPIGDPLTGHTDTVTAIATTVLATSRGSVDRSNPSSKEVGRNPHFTESRANHRQGYVYDAKSL